MVGGQQLVLTALVAARRCAHEKQRLVRRLTVAPVAPLALALLITGCGQSAVLPTLGNCLHRNQVKPVAISFCGDGNFYVTGLRWRKWTRANAVGIGVAHKNTCKPFCAGARFRTFRVRVILSRPRSCSDRSVQFTRVAWVTLGSTSQRSGRARKEVSAPLSPGVSCV